MCIIITNVVSSQQSNLKNLIPQYFHYDILFLMKTTALSICEIINHYFY